MSGPSIQKHNDQQPCVKNSAHAKGVHDRPSSSHQNGDYLLYKAFLAYNEELGTLADAQTSIAELSSALYENMVPNSTKRLQDLQNNLSDYTLLQNNFSDFKKYFASGEKPGILPPALSRMIAEGKLSPSDMKKIQSASNHFKNLTSLRGETAALAQEISVQNTYVQDSKVLADGVQADVKTLANDQVQVTGFIGSLLELPEEQERLWN